MDSFIRGVSRQLLNLKSFQQLSPAENAARSTPDKRPEPDKQVTIHDVFLLEEEHQFGSGTLFLTSSHIIFLNPSRHKELWIAFTEIQCVERLGLQSSESGFHVRVCCKSFRRCVFGMLRETDYCAVYTHLQHATRVTCLQDLPCFTFPSTGGDTVDTDYDAVAEFARMGVPSTCWALSDVNAEYALCSTYPRHLVFPAELGESVLRACAQFRSRGRLPALTYLYAYNQASITRCSQPLAGLRRRCVEDERMVQAIRRANPASSCLYVVDTRPRVNAFVNRAAGKGYETLYANVKFFFFAVENIHVMRASLQRLIEATQTTAARAYWHTVQSSGWLRHVKALLETAWFVATSVGRRGVSVLVHCSDGWDRTAQVCALAQLLLDPHYRTVRGFQTLVEKDWLSFGHKFTDRSGLLTAGGAGGTVNSAAAEDREQAPVFTQFLDCVWQLLRMEPSAFEFNEPFLLALHAHQYTGQYGTLVGNCERERAALWRLHRTQSLWTHVQAHAHLFRNPFYEPCSHPDMLQVSVSTQSLCVWRHLYARHRHGVHARHDIWRLAAQLWRHNDLLHDYVCYMHELRRRLMDSSSDACPLTQEELVTARAMLSVTLDWTPEGSTGHVTLCDVDGRSCDCGHVYARDSDDCTRCHVCAREHCTRCVYACTSSSHGAVRAALRAWHAQPVISVCRTCLLTITRASSVDLN